MQVRVKLLGILPSYYAGSYTEAGLNLDIPTGSTINDLVEVVGIPRERIAIVTINDVLAKADHPVPENGVIKLMHRLAGG
jgi:sulfur carrier protein ThiS